MPPSEAAPSRPSLSSLAITQAIGIICFVLIPALVTFVVPRTTIELRSVDNAVEAVVTTHVFLFVPIWARTISPVTDVTSKVRADEYKADLDAQERRKGTAHYRAGDGSILLTGANGTTQIQSTPEDAPKDAERIKGFLAAPSPQSIVITATAGWLFTYLLGGIMTGLAALFCGGATLAVLKSVLGMARPG